MNTDEIMLSQHREVEFRLQQAALLLKHSQELDKAKVRIRELEKDLRLFKGEVEIWHGRAAECIIRMSRAREILRDRHSMDAEDSIDCALNALEGK